MPTNTHPNVATLANVNRALTHVIEHVDARIRRTLFIVVRIEVN